MGAAQEKNPYEKKTNFNGTRIGRFKVSTEEK